MRPWHFLRFFGVLATSIVLCVSLMAGCGRTSLEPEDLVFADGGTSSSSSSGGPTSCGPSNCSTGCCDSNGKCQTGHDVAACGSLGGSCTNCTAGGYTSCTTSRVCSKTVSVCDSSSCPTGCCTTDGAGNLECTAGNESTACGTGGETCTNCENTAQACDITTRQCSQAKCDASNCTGCCVGDLCLPGNSAIACGANGGQCGTCGPGQVCQITSAGGGQCIGTVSCGPANCGGCCDQFGSCRTGTDDSACGVAGGACSECDQFGESCDPSSRTCAPTTCDASSCPFGCCQNGVCIDTFPGDSLCGLGGGQCQTCTNGQICDGAGTCIDNSACGFASCPTGCCVNDICAVGTQNTACGSSGAQCQNCTNLGETCQGQACTAPVCSPANCPFGCCSNGVCVGGNSDGACGIGGKTCSSCDATQTCSGNTCVQKCTAATCPNGCCQNNTCVAGISNDACGTGGVACSSCTADGAFCDGLVTPRRCSDNQSTCPASYGKCPGGTTEAVIKSAQGVCTDQELNAAQIACADPTSQLCQTAISVAGACGTCMSAFAHPFSERTGLYACAAAFVQKPCRDNLGCAVDCATSSCNGCSTSATASCYTLVDSNNGQCNSFAQAASCADTALAAGQLCSQFSYADFGTWFSAVGAHFCGNGP